MTKTYEIPLFPLNTVLFPGMILPLHVFEERYKSMIKRCVADSQPFGVVLLRSGQAEGEYNKDVYEIGTTARINQINALPDGRFQILTQGVQRFRIHQTDYSKPYMTAMVEAYPLLDTHEPRTDRIARKISGGLVKYLEFFKTIGVGEVEIDLEQFPTDPVTLAFLTAIIIPIENEEKQKLLGIMDVYSLLLAEINLLRRETLFLRVLTQEQPDWVKAGESTFSPN